MPRLSITQRITNTMARWAKAHRSEAFDRARQRHEPRRVEVAAPRDHSPAGLRDAVAREELAQQAGQRVQRNRVEAEDDEGPAPRLPAANVDERVAHRQEDGGGAAREPDVRTRPDLLVDGERQAPQQADDHRREPGTDEPHGLLAAGGARAEPQPRHASEERRRERRNRAQQPLGIPRLGLRRTGGSRRCAGRGRRRGHCRA